MLALAMLPQPDLCEIITHGDLYDGKEVIVEGELLATFEATMLSDETCGGVYVKWSPGDEPRMKSFESAYFDSRTSHGQKPPYVKLKGIYHAHVPHEEDSLRQLELKEVLEVKKR